jgi:hypothetical protein
MRKTLATALEIAVEAAVAMPWTLEFVAMASTLAPSELVRR